MVAATRLEPSLDPLALVVFDDDRVGTPIVDALKNKGFRTFSIHSILGDSESLGGLYPELIILDIRRDLFAAAKTLAELAKRPLSPPVVLIADEEDARRFAARFRLLSVRSDTSKDELLRVVDRARREQRRPVAHS
jgi:DNA-binding response OmpR family regulator